MTGFGRAENVHNGVAFQVEASSVNRKQADVSVGIPRELSQLETPIRKAVLARVSRGRITVNIRYESIVSGEESSSLIVDENLAAGYIAGVAKIAERHGIPAGLDASDLLRIPGVFESQESVVDPGDAWPGIESAVTAAITDLITMRESEGAHLKDELSDLLSKVEGEAQAIDKLAPGVVDHYRKSLHARLAEAGVDVPLDDERVVREIGIFAEKCDISEELARLRSHVTKFREYLESDEPTGRSLDFLAQELFREFNTIGAKANHAEIAQGVVRGKTEVEKIREQAQNVE